MSDEHPSISLASLKYCPSCEQQKPTSCFYPLAHTKDGLNWRCTLCQSEYNREYNHKKALEKCDLVLVATYSLIPRKFQVRFLRKITRLDKCWRWTGSLHPNSGYGRFWIEAHTDRLAHRLSYQWATGEIPQGLTIDHQCRNRWCVNPQHLRPMTNVENVMIGMSPFAINARKTHCPKGHEYTPENTGRAGSERYCKECRKIYKRQVRARKATNEAERVLFLS